MSTAATGVLQKMARGLESRDPELLSTLYADDAELRFVDRRNPPSNPRILRGRAEVDEYLVGNCRQDLTHSVGDETEGDDRVAFTVSCRYDDGVRVLCAAVADLDSDGRIARQINVQAWDE